MYVYQLELNIVKKYPFNIFNYCNIYMSLEEAKKDVKNYLKLISKHNKIKNKDINEFCITQIDLEYSNNFSLTNKTKEICIEKYKPTHVHLHYNILGKLIYKELEWNDKNKGLSYSILKYPRRRNFNSRTKI